MKKLILMVAVVATVGLTSCGGDSPEDLAQEVCDCMKDAGTDMDKLNKCKDLGPEHAKKIGTDKDAAEAYTKKVMECSKEIASDLQK